MKITESQLLNRTRPSPDQHPDADQLVQLLEPTMDAVERERLLDHLSTCSHCALAMQQVMALENDTVALAESLASASQLQGRPPRRWLPPMALAASVLLCALLLIILLPDHLNEQDPIVRGTSESSRPAAGQVLTTPPASLGWQAAYRTPVNVILMDAAARPLWQSAPTEQDSVRLPNDLALQPGQYFWQIYDSTNTVVAGPYWFEIQ